jgi:glycosyltransferase involved in cell wall biosynthesis
MNPPINAPKISPLPPEGSARPFWSVMIPAYNPPGTYLEQTLRSVLQQDPGPQMMQIQVVDDCSPGVDVKKMVKSIANDRVIYSRMPENLGLAGCWNACIERSRGQWVHILHQDDMVLPGFYAALRKGAEVEKVGAAFCRHAYFDSECHWDNIEPLERKTPGVLDNWIEKIGQFQRIQTPAIVVRRAVYESLGGFLKELCFALDWEMWRRISVSYAVWYEPGILACYRFHSGTTTSSLRQRAADVEDMRRSIELVRGYLPAASAEAITRRAMQRTADWALANAKMFLSCDNYPAMLRQCRGALKCTSSPAVLGRVARLGGAAGLRSTVKGAKTIAKRLLRARREKTV